MGHYGGPLVNQFESQIYIYVITWLKFLTFTKPNVQVFRNYNPEKGRGYAVAVPKENENLNEPGKRTIIGICYGKRRLIRWTTP